MTQPSEFLLFPEYRLSVASKTPLKFINHENLPLESLMDFVLRGVIPRPKIRSFVDEVDSLYRSPDFVKLSSEERLRFLEEKYPESKSLFEVILAGEDIWRSYVRREYESLDGRVVDIVNLLDERGYTDSSRLAVVAKEISDHFKIRKYKMRALLDKETVGTIDNLFDSLNITDDCRQIVLVKPLASRVQHKLSNKFEDRATKIHSQRSLVDIPSRKNRLNNYMGMTFNKHRGSNKVVTVFIEEKPAKTPYEDPVLEIMFENLEDADGEVVHRYLVQTVSDLTPRGKALKEYMRKLKLDVFDIELSTSAYNSEFVRQALIDLSSKEPLRRILFSESKTRVDDQRFCIRNLISPGRVRARADIQEKITVFSSPRDIFETLDLISLFLSYSQGMRTIDILGTGVGVPRWSEVTGVADSDGSERYMMDIIEIRPDGERVLRKAKFFDSVFNKVCNKPENVPIFGEALDITREGVVFDYFPPKQVINKLVASGRYEFPRYQTQRIPIQTFYGDVVIGGGKRTEKVRVLGRRKIPRERRDEMAGVENLAYIFGYFPCVINVKKSEYNATKGREGIIEMEEEDEEGDEEGGPVGGEHIYDETKDEFPVGRVARTQMFFFDILKRGPSSDILRGGVPEGPSSFFQAVKVASGKGSDTSKTVENLIRELETETSLVQAGFAQFPDSKPKEVKKFVSDNEFMDSRYLVNIVGEYFGVNVVVMEYSQSSQNLDYALYELPRGSIPQNIFEQLDMERKTVVILRRRYQAIYDQYDYLLERNPEFPPRTQFETSNVKQFLRTKLTFVDLVPDIYSQGLRTRIVDLSRNHFSLSDDDPLKEVFQVLDSVGSRIGTLFATENSIYPCIHLTPLSQTAGIRIGSFNELLNEERPSIETIALDLGVTEFDGFGELVLRDFRYVTSVMVEELIFLCKPTIMNERVSPLFRKAIAIETPDPYISRQFSRVEEPQTILRRRRFAEIISSLLLQILFIEVLERYVIKNTFETRSYAEWRRGILKKDSKQTPDIDSVSEPLLLGLIGEIKSLNGVVRPISWFLSNKERFSRICDFFTAEGSIRCFSPTMLARLESQLVLMERITPSLNIQTYVPRSVYRIKGLYETLVSLSQSPESVNGVNIEGYRIWQERCRISFESTNIHPGIYKPFFNVSGDQPIIGFHGNNGGTGLWVMQSKPVEGNSYPVFGNSLPRIVYLKEKDFEVFLPETPSNVIRLKKLG